MNQVLLAAVSAPKPTVTSGKSSDAEDVKFALPGAGDMFRSTLAQRLLARPAPAKAGPPAASGDTLKARSALEAKIAKLSQSGASQADIIQTLAGQLAGAIAHTLDLPGSDARMTLQTVFATALAPPGDGTNGDGAEPVRALADRFLRLEALAGSIAGHSQGQQKRIAGEILDARRAKDIPAPNTITGAALGQISAGGSPSMALGLAAPDGQSPSRLPGNAPPLDFDQRRPANANGPAQDPGDGRTVSFDLTTALSTGGDTGLGRILTRAQLMADTRQTAAGIGVSPAATAAGNGALADGTTAVDATAAADARVTAFVQSLSVALDANAPGRVASGADDPGSGASVPNAPGSAAPSPHHEAPTSISSAAPAATDVTTGYAPAMAPFAIERVAPPVAAGAPSVAEAVDHSAIADQVLRGAFMRNLGASSEMRLSLVPESLGDVRIKLIVSEGSVTAHVLAETPQVRDALVAAQPQLVKSLADAGLKLSSFSVDLSGSGFAGFSQQQPDRSPHGSRRGGGFAASDEPAGDGPLEAIPSFGPSVIARPHAGDYNYLA